MVVGEVNTATELIFPVEAALEGGFTARALGESIFTKADTVPISCVQTREFTSELLERTHRTKTLNGCAGLEFSLKFLGHFKLHLERMTGSAKLPEPMQFMAQAMHH